MNNMTKEKTLFRVVQTVWYIFFIIEALLITRFVLKLFAANPGAGFTELIYNLTAILVAPFLYVFSPNAVAGGVIEWGTLLALLVYWIVAMGIVRLLSMGRSVSSSEADTELRSEDKSI